MIKMFLIIFALAASCMEKPVSDDLSVLPLNENGIDSILSAGKGKVILVNLWATWCIPCKEEMPDLIKLKNQYNKEDFELILISLDEEDKIQTAALEFLKNTGADFETYYNDFNKDEDLINYFDKDWDGAIPATFIIDKDGKISAGFIGKKDYETFHSEVSKLM